MNTVELLLLLLLLLLPSTLDEDPWALSLGLAFFSRAPEAPLLCFLPLDEEWYPELLFLFSPDGLLLCSLPEPERLS